MKISLSNAITIDLEEQGVSFTLSIQEAQELVEQLNALLRSQDPAPKCPPLSNPLLEWGKLLPPAPTPPPYPAYDPWRYHPPPAWPNAPIYPGPPHGPFGPTCQQQP